LMMAMTSFKRLSPQSESVLVQHSNCRARRKIIAVLRVFAQSTVAKSGGTSQFFVQLRSSARKTGRHPAPV
ncbi:hypothetical protein, partial [Sphingomonas sp. 32-62-10]|uniref:hypothetical protein n=1 Tax=Sphingomonas sp. 32-62-10 TaxID=1970436 RepID=UPI0035A877A4